MRINKSWYPRSRRSWQLITSRGGLFCSTSLCQSWNLPTPYGATAPRNSDDSCLSGWRRVHGPYWGVAGQPDLSPGATTDSRSEIEARQMRVSATFLHLPGSWPRCGRNSSYQWEGARDCWCTSATRPVWGEWYAITTSSFTISTLSWSLCIISYRRTSPGLEAQLSKLRTKSQRGCFSQQTY